MFHVRQENIPQDCNSIDVENSILGGNKEKINALGGGPQEPIELKIKDYNEIKTYDWYMKN